MPKLKKREKQELKPRLHIFCEGEKTEPNYLNWYIGGVFPGTKLIIVEETKKNTPVQLVEEALKAKTKEPDGDIFWVVYDREGQTKYPDAFHADARQKAGKQIHIAISNICFEVWLLLHFQKTVAAYSNCADLLKKSKLKKEYIKDYDKANKRHYSPSEIASAREYAKHMNNQTKKGANPAWTQCHQWNPYTDVYKLLDAIDEFGNKYIRQA